VSALPPLNALRAFEAAARHGGFAGAADELCVTRGAISRHVKLLEARLGVALFARLPQGVRLTAAGRRLVPEVTGAFASIERAVRAVSEDAGGLRILCPPATSIRWLLPRVGTFEEAHPGIRLRLTTDFYGGGSDWSAFDLGFSVERHPGRAPDIAVQPLFPVRLTPAAAPAYLEAQGIRAPSDLARATLLHETRARDDWRTWLTAHDLRSADAATERDFPNLDMAVQAAVMGAGVVMADLVLCRAELDSGALVAPFAKMVCEGASGGIALIGPRDRWDAPPVAAFRAWAAAEAERAPP
jgi:DNA-binding transcriptional LysR family regulator